MNTLKNKVQLIGNIGQEPIITNLQSGKKVARFSLATNENYKNTKGEKQTNTNWHHIVAWGKTAEIIEKFARKGKEIAVAGKLKTRSFEAEDKSQRTITEVEVNEVFLSGSKSSDTTNE